jgi:hypothetical protein
MLFNGAPSFVASMKKDSEFGNIITFQDSTEKTIKIDATGFPSGPGASVEIGDSEETAKPVEFKDKSSGNMLRQRNWWNEDEKRLYCKLFFIEAEKTLLQTRFLINDDTLQLLNEMTLKNGSKCGWEAVFKRV